MGWRRSWSSASLYGSSRFDKPIEPERKKSDVVSQVLSHRDRWSREPTVQWQAQRRKGWVDLSAEVSDNLETHYFQGKTHVGIWSEGMYNEFDLRDMVAHPGVGSLRRVKWEDPVHLETPSLKGSWISEFDEYQDLRSLYSPDIWKWIPLPSQRPEYEKGRGLSIVQKRLSKYGPLETRAG